MRVVLHQQFLLWQYFFEDFNGKMKAPDAFMIAVVTKLKSHIHDSGMMIFDRGQEVKELHLIAQGNCELYGYYTDSAGVEYRTLIVNLPTCSWYGDFQILLDIKTTFEFYASTIKSKDDVSGYTGFANNNKNSSPGKILTYTLQADTLLELCQ